MRGVLVPVWTLSAGCGQIPRLSVPEVHVLIGGSPPCQSTSTFKEEPMAQLPNRLPAVAAASVTTAFLVAFPSVALADDGTTGASGGDTTGGTSGTTGTTGTTEGTTTTTPTTGSDPVGEAIGSL